MMISPRQAGLRSLRTGSACAGDLCRFLSGARATVMPGLPAACCIGRISGPPGSRWGRGGWLRALLSSATVTRAFPLLVAAGSLSFAATPAGKLGHVWCWEPLLYQPNIQIDTTIDLGQEYYLSRYYTRGFRTWLCFWSFTVSALRQPAGLGYDIVVATHRSRGRLVEERPELGWAQDWVAVIQDFVVMGNVNLSAALGPVTLCVFAGGGLDVAYFAINPGEVEGEVGCDFQVFGADYGARLLVRIAGGVALSAMGRGYAPWPWGCRLAEGVTLHPETHPIEASLGFCIDAR